MGSKLLALRSSLISRCIWSEQTFHFNGLVIKFKNSECFQKKFELLFFIEKVGDLGA